MFNSYHQKFDDLENLAKITVASIALILLVMLGLMFYWDKEPELLDIDVPNAENKVIGQAYTGTLIKIGETLLDKRGGYLSNDVMPPSVLMDNIPNWEFGALVMLRDGSAALRNHFSRSQSQSVENSDLANAEPQFNFQNNSWMFPATEGEYRMGLKGLVKYYTDLSGNSSTQAQFFARADNLHSYLVIIEKRLGSLSQRLSASVGEVRENTNLAGDSAAKQSTSTSAVLNVKTDWMEIDDVFYEARGTSWALYHLLKAIKVDFDAVLKKKNAHPSLNHIIRELKATQESISSPMIMNGRGFGLTANYSLIMANYISRANAAIIDLRDLLENG